MRTGATNLKAWAAALVAAVVALVAGAKPAEAVFPGANWVGRARTLAFFALALLVAGLIGVVLAARPAHAATTFTVNSTGDAADADTTDNICDSDAETADEQCTLRAAIQQANATSGTDEIHFSIPGSGVHTITPSSLLPPITAPVTIDGYKQDSDTSDTSDDAKPNTLEQGNNAVLKIELDGTNVGTGLRIWAANSTVKGLIINRFGGTGVSIDSGLNNIGSNKLEGNYIGTDAAGIEDLGNGSGVSIKGNNNTVGGTQAEARNIISGNDMGVVIAFGGVTGNRVVGNYIGTDKDGDDDLGNSLDGVNLGFGVSNNTVGGEEAGARNIISGNGRFGVILSGGATLNQVKGNYIGADASGTIDLGNTDDGVRVDSGASNNIVGGTDASDGTVDGDVKARNIIFGNGGDGIEVSYWQNSNNPEENDLTPATGNSILSNSIYDNDALGIDLATPPDEPPGVTNNDKKDRDTGPNNRQNYPVLSSATLSGGQITIKGLLNSTRRKPFTIQFFSSPLEDTSTYGEGKTFLGEIQVKTNRKGKRSFSTTFSPLQPVSPEEKITATATRLVPNPGDPTDLSPTDTSEFSKAVTAS